MPNAALRLLRPFVVAALVVVSVSAFATAQRTFVSSNGNDTGPCSITAPCRSFLAAIAQTSADGEVIVQDSAGYGAVTITKSVSIIAPAGIYGGISVFSGNGITINGSSIAVVLRGLTINGQGGDFGVYFLQGTKLTIEDCEIAHMTFDGIIASAPGSTVAVKNTVMRDNGRYGFLATGSVVATLDGVHAQANGSAGVIAISGPRVTIANSVLANNGIDGVTAGADSGTVTDVMVTRSTVTGNPVGLEVFTGFAGSGNLARLVSDGNVITNVAIAAFRFTTGPGTETIYTLGNNTVGFQNAIVVGGSLTPLSTL